MKDNGWARFEKVRVPKSHFLSKYAQVTKEGEFVKPPHKKLQYATMTLVRVDIVNRCFPALAKAATIGIRYSLVRRQGYLRGEEKAEKEMKVLDFHSQQRRIFPYLASAYAFRSVGRQLLSLYHQVQKDLKQQNFESLPDLHATSSALKAYCSWTACKGIDEIRQRLGGHGYSMYSNLYSLFFIHFQSLIVSGSLEFVISSKNSRQPLPTKETILCLHFIHLFISSQLFSLV